MQKLIVGIGVPGSGKTTALKAFAERNGYAYISPDEIRKAFTGSEMDQSRNAEVWKEAYRKLAVRFQEGTSVVFDATFAKPHERKEFLRFARDAGAEKVQGVFINAPLEVIKERNIHRERKLPEYALDRIHGQLNEFPPELTDGFDSIFTLDEYQNLIEAERMHNGELKKRSFR